MLSLVRVFMFLLVILEKPTSPECFKSGDTGRDLKTIIDIANEFILSFDSGNDFMDIFVNTDCLKDNTVLFKTFLDSRAKPVTFWTDGKMHSRLCNNKICYSFRRSFFQMVYFICGKYDLNNLWHSLTTNYFMSAFVVAENANNPMEHDPKFFSAPFQPPYPRASGRYVMNFDNGSLFMTSEFERKVIERQSLTRGLLEQQRTLNGSLIHLTCENAYACQHPSFNVTLQLLTHRNASVHVARRAGPREWVLSTLINSLNNNADRDNGGFFSALHHFESAGFSFYVRKRHPVPKETIFILPFSWEVWVGLLASGVLLVLTYGLIAKVILKANVNISVLLFPMVAAFFQQSTQLHTSLLSKSSSRMLYGIMAIMFVVMSTAFKGRLTSLLNNLPLEGEVKQFVSFEHLVRTGHRLCFLEHPGFLGALGSLIIFTRNGPIRTGRQCYQTSRSVSGSLRSIKISADGRDTFFTYNSRTGPSEALRGELLRRGYVEVEGFVFSYPVGPEMRSSSVYRRDFGATLSRAIEAGLYERYARLANYKSRYFHESSSEHTQELVLTISDLRPFFLAWFLGISFSVLVLIGEAISSCVGCRKRSYHARRIVKRPLQHRIRTGRLTKINPARVLKRN